MSVVRSKTEIAVRLGIPPSHDFGHGPPASFKGEGPGSLLSFGASERVNNDVRPVHRSIPLCKEGS
jgi:hypothetical protein